MRLTVTDRGHDRAVLALVNANLVTARASIDLANRLQGYGGMAGDDSTATEFAASYDEAAAATVEALQSLVGACNMLAHLVEASLANHRRAEERSTLPGWALPLTGPPTAADSSIGVTLTAPPSSLGADSSGPGGLAGVALDVLHDVFWPNADTERLRSAAAVWSRAADSLGLLTARCDTAVAALDGERSPEIPLAVAAIDGLHRRVDDLSDQLTSLATACSGYADDVDAKRHELRELLEDLAVDLGVGAVVAGGLSVLSGGAAAGFAGGAGAAHIASASSRFRSILDSLRVLTAGAAWEVRPVAVTAGEVGSFSTRISRARVMLMEAGEGGAATSRGALGRFPKGFLERHESRIGHTLREHVGLSRARLERRFVEKPHLRRASTFRNQREAESAVEQVFRTREPDIQRWLSQAEESKSFTVDLGRDVGDVLVKATGEMVRTSKARIVLIPDETMPEGWRLLTAYPTL